MQYQGSKKVLNRVPFRRFWDFTVAAWNKSCQTILDVLSKVNFVRKEGLEPSHLFRYHILSVARLPFRHFRLSLSLR